MNGTVKRLVKDKKFGFIKGEDGSEYFFHQSALRAGAAFDQLREGDEVTFEEEASAKGPRASEVYLRDN